MVRIVLKQATATPCRRLILVLALSSAAGLAMLAFRLAYAGRAGYLSLPWDLLLAWVPVPLALGVARLHDKPRRSLPAMLGLTFLWLLFFPNAPYLLTEFMHLHPSHAVYDGPVSAWFARWTPPASVPLWFDVLMLSMFAWTGLLLGFMSLHVIHRCANHVLGRAGGWIIVLMGLSLCAFGVSLGRFERWNSWDLFTDPLTLLADIGDRALNPIAHLRTSGATLMLAGFLVLGYLSLVALMHFVAGDHDRGASHRSDAEGTQAVSALSASVR
jgi:uncharacterized membrane protein